MLTKYIQNLRNHLAGRLNEFSVYVAANAFIFILPVIATPILARYLSTEEFGIWAIYLLFSSYFIHFVRFELNLVIKKAFKKDKKSLPSLMFLSLLTVSGLGTTLGLFVLFGYRLIDRVLDEYSYFIWIALVASVLKSISMLAHGYMQITGEVKTYAFVNVFANVLLYALVLYFIIVSGNGVAGRVFADVLVSLAITAHSIWFLVVNGVVKINFRVSLLKKNFANAMAPFLLSIFVISFASFDRIFVAYAFDTDKLGIYSVAVQFASLITVLTSSAAPVIERIFYNAEEGAKLEFVSIISLLAALIVGILIFSKIVSVAILVLMPPTFHGAADYTFVALLSVLSSFLIALGISFINSISNLKNILFSFASLITLSFFFGYILSSVNAYVESLVFIYIFVLSGFALIIFREYKLIR